ncbi:MAG: histidine kinase [Bacteroidales bacterium]|nr:histidine kinase [Bacteroidales bacterium]
MAYYRFLFLFLLLIALRASAQTPVSRHFTSDDGLPSSEVYSAVQDNTGYFWFSTDHGVARFDGYHFDVFDKQNGLPENTVFNFQKDPWGRIWVDSYNGFLAFWNGTRFVAYEHNALLSAYLKTLDASITVYSSYEIMPDSSILFNLIGRGQHLIHPDGRLEHLPNKGPKGTIDVELIDNGKVHFNSNNNTDKLKLFIYDRNKSYTLHTMFEDTGTLRRWQISARHRDGALYLGLSRRIFEIRSDSVFHTHGFSSRIIAIETDANGNLWVGTLRDGVFLFKDGNLNRTPHNYLSGNAISSVSFDHEGGTWLTTLNSGVYYLPDLNLYRYAASEGLPRSRIIQIETDPQGNIWLAYEQKKLFRIAGKQITQFTLEGAPETEISKLLYDKQNHCLWIGTNVNLYYQKNDRIFTVPNNFKPGLKDYQGRFPGIKDMTFNPLNHDIWMGNFAGISNYDKEGKVTVLTNYSKVFTERVESIAVDTAGTIWMGTLRGLWRSKNGQFESMASTDKLLGERITQVKILHDTLWLGSRGNGLLIYANDTLRQYTAASGLASNSINFIETGEKYLVIGTNMGINIINRKIVGGKLQIQTMNASTGLPTNEITALKLKNDSLFIGTSSGLVVYNINQMKLPDVHFPLMFTGLQIDGVPTTFRPDIRIPFAQNSVNIDYFAISYRNKGKLTYRHRLRGLEKDWVLNQKTNATYPYLPPGDYTFELSAQNLLGQWNPNPATFSFSVKAPFWQTWWFYLLLAALITAVFFIIITLRIRLLKKRNQLIYDVNRYRQEALINQMNPHFLFNALNTVQRFILENDKIASSKYLSKFAKLMRRVLENSQKQHITLQEEIDALSLYLELESARFHERFQYDIIVEPGMNTNLVILPVFIVQPIVENAIWHGLMNSPKDGLLTIEFLFDGRNGIRCLVRDNGIGRMEAQKISNSRERKSFGGTIIQKRISLMNQQEKKHISLRYNDLTDADGKAAGTEVTIIFPDSIQETPR